VADMNCYNQDA